MMKNETFLDFIFIQEAIGGFSSNVRQLLQMPFQEQSLHCSLKEKTENGLDILIMKVKGKSSWFSEKAMMNHLDKHVDDEFWELLQGYQCKIYRGVKGCQSCGNK